MSYGDAGGPNGSLVLEVRGSLQIIQVQGGPRNGSESVAPGYSGEDGFT